MLLPTNPAPPVTRVAMGFPPFETAGWHDTTNQKGSCLSAVFLTLNSSKHKLLTGQSGALQLDSDAHCEKTNRIASGSGRIPQRL